MKDIDGFILVGGKSSRMRRDKANLQLDGKTFVERAAFALSGVAENLFVVGNSKENLHGLPILSDTFYGENNLAENAAIIGLQTALKNTKTTWTAILACDLPFASRELFIKTALFLDDKIDAVAPIQQDGRPQPLCAVYRSKSCLPIVEKMLRGDDWSLQKLLRRLHTRFIAFDEISDLPDSERFFFNVNTPEDYAQAQLMSAEFLSNRVII